MRGGRGAQLKIMNTDGYYHYHVKFEYKNESYTCEFFSTAKITPQTDKLAAWGIADDAIKERMQTIPDRHQGVYPHSIMITGEFGTLVVDE